MPAISARRIAPPAVALCVAVVCLAGCQAMSDRLAPFPAYALVHSPHSALSATAPQRVRIHPTRDERTAQWATNVIGRREGVFNQDMGAIELDRPPASIIAEMVAAEFSAASHVFAGAGDEAPATEISPSLLKFEFDVAVTPLTWRIDGAVAFDLAVAPPDAPALTRQYESRCARTTLIWPTAELVVATMEECLAGVATQLREDAALAAAMRWVSP
ncbi:MAG: hypothetical protein GC206_12900 [Alphaproteobacteria bacterium]|nr:hypothetical protein [Alphaproteobacteria bacterium]